MEKIRESRRSPVKSTALISVLLLTIHNVYSLNEAWGEEWSDAREDIDSGFAAFAWLVAFGLLGSLLLVIAGLMALLNFDPPNLLLLVGIILVLLGTGGFVAHSFGFLLGVAPLWASDCAALALASLGGFIFYAVQSVA